MRIHLLSGALLALGCAGAQHFDAAEHATAVSPRGDIAAEYDVDGPTGRVAEARVWLRGAYEDRVDGREMTVIEVVFDVENESAAPVTLSRLELASADVDGVTFDDLPPVRVEGDRVVRPGGEGEVRAYFALQQRYDPEDIEQLEVRWALSHAKGTYAQRTPFHQAPPPYSSYATAYLPYAYDPAYRPLGAEYYAGRVVPP